MSTREDLYTALRNADKAGDNEAAEKLAAYIQSLPLDSAAPERVATSARPPVTALERANAVPAGFNSAVAALLGLPMDTAANVVDLAKAGMGYGYSKISGKPVPSAFEVGSHESVPGGGAWIRNLMGSAARVPRPEDTASRYLAAAGAAGPAVLATNPATIGEAGASLASNLTANMAGQGAADLTRNMDPTTQTLAAASAQMLGAAIPNTVAARIAQPVRGQLTPGQQETVATADANDIPIDAASRTGSTFLRRMRNLSSDNPFTAGGQKEFSDTQKTAINRAMLRTIGEDAPRATPEVMGRANDRIGQAMDDIAQRNPAQFDTVLAGDIQQAQNTLVRTVPESMRGPIETNISDIFEAAQQNGGVIPGPVYQRTRAALQTLSQDPKVAPVAMDLREALDNALARSIQNPDDAPALQQARLQWRNMRTIEGAISKDNEGNISPAIVANTLGTKGMGNRNRSVYGRGNQELPELARAGKAIMDQDPNSGTPLRLAGQSAPAMIGGAVVSALTGNPALQSHWEPLVTDFLARCRPSTTRRAWPDTWRKASLQATYAMRCSSPKAWTCDKQHQQISF
ncbi:MAG: hypothetical protein WDO56_35135 [Gammaproteobacteria bacterium]